MFISVLDLFKVGIGPSSSHTVGPMIAAERYRKRIADIAANHHSETRIKCVLKGSLAHTGKGHGTDKAVILGLHGYLPNQLISEDVDHLYQRLLWQRSLELPNEPLFSPQHDLNFDLENSFTQQPNGMEFSLLDEDGECFRLGVVLFQPSKRFQPSKHLYILQPKSRIPFLLKAQKK